MPCATVTKDGVVELSIESTTPAPWPPTETVFVFVLLPGSAVANPRRQVQGAEGRTTGQARRWGRRPARKAVTIPLRELEAIRPEYWDTTSRQAEVGDRQAGEGDRGAERRPDGHSTRPALSDGDGELLASDTFTLN